MPDSSDNRFDSYLSGYHIKDDSIPNFNTIQKPKDKLKKKKGKNERAVTQSKYQFLYDLLYVFRESYSSCKGYFNRFSNRHCSSIIFPSHVRLKYYMPLYAGFHFSSQREFKPRYLPRGLLTVAHALMKDGTMNNHDISLQDFKTLLYGKLIEYNNKYRYHGRANQDNKKYKCHYDKQPELSFSYINDSRKTIYYNIYCNQYKWTRSTPQQWLYNDPVGWIENMELNRPVGNTFIPNDKTDHHGYDSYFIAFIGLLLHRLSNYFINTSENYIETTLNTIKTILTTPPTQWSSVPPIIKRSTNIYEPKSLISINNIKVIRKNITDHPLRKTLINSSNIRSPLDNSSGCRDAEKCKSLFFIHSYMLLATKKVIYNTANPTGQLQSKQSQSEWWDKKALKFIPSLQILCQGSLGSQGDYLYSLKSDNRLDTNGIILVRTRAKEWRVCLPNQYLDPSFWRKNFGGINDSIKELYKHRHHYDEDSTFMAGYGILT